jgi:predicted nucleotidyltransferase
MGTTVDKVVLPESIRRVIDLGVRAVNPDRVILYGSRARGDWHEGSDYDLAFVFPPERRSQWVRFVVDLDEAAVTLLPVDLLDWNEASTAVREQVEREGVALYERVSEV